jgi:hypothetical protein
LEAVLPRVQGVHLIAPGGDVGTAFRVLDSLVLPREPALARPGAGG